MKFTITIEEMISESFEVEAESADIAMKIAEEKYSNGEFILEPGNVVAKQMAITCPINELTEWAEF